MCVCQHLKVGQLQAQIDSLALQLHNAQAAVLAHQRERLLAEHKLSQAEHQVAKLTQLLQAGRRHKFSTVLYTVTILLGVLYLIIRSLL